MIEYEYFDLFGDDSKDKQWIITYTGGQIKNEDLFSESLEITESLCSEQELRFGCCESSSVKFKVANIFSGLLGKEITIRVYVGGHSEKPLTVGKYKVASDKLTADRMWREIVAYDAMHDVINADVAKWYNNTLPNESSTVTMSALRSGFAAHFSLTESVPAGGLVNDTMPVKKTIQPEEISGKDMLFAICEANGCFARIGRDGKLHYIYLDQAIQGLYPADDLFPDRAPEHLSQHKTGHLYPQDPKYVPIAGDKNYIECTYEDYLTKSISHVLIRGDENDAGYTYPETSPGDKDNLYTIQDNFLLYGKTDSELKQIIQNLLSKISDITYRPFNLKVRANPCLEVGDPVRVQTNYHIVESYVLQRTMSGIQAFTDSITTPGAEKYEENVNSVQKSIVQLKGKTNTLTRTSEETKSELKDLENSTESRFTQTAEQISAEVTRATEAEGVLTANLSITAEGLSSEVTRAKGAEATLSSSITQTATEIRSEVANADAALSSSITQNANNIALKVSKGDVSSQLSIESGQVTISGNRLVVDSSNFALDASGNCYIKNSLKFDAGDGAVEIIGHDASNRAYLKDILVNENTIFSLNGNGRIATMADIPSVPDIPDLSDYVKGFKGDSISGVYNSIYVSYASDFGITVYDKYIFGSKISYSDLNDRLGGSDRRIKDHIKPLGDITDIYMRFSPVEYYFKDGLKEYSRRRQYGLIAQDAEENLISHEILDSGIVYKKKSAEDLNENLYTDGETYKIDYDQLHAMHIYMVQKQQREIEILKSELSDMRKEINLLKSKIEGGVINE